MIRTAQHTRLIASAVALGSLLLAADARAGAEKAAKKTLAKAAKTAVENLDNQLKAREKALTSSTLSLIKTKAKNGVATTSDAYTLGTALNEFQIDARDLYVDAFVEMAEGLKAAMAILQGDGISPADYPRGFGYGEAGPLLDFRNDADALMVKRYAKLAKKLDNLSEDLEASGVGLCVNILPPSRPRERSPSWSSMGSYSTNPGLTLDLLVSHSALDQTNDAVIRAFGTADAGSDLTFMRLYSNGFSTNSAVFVGSDDRWAHTLTGMPEINATYLIATDDGGAAERAGLGAR